MILTFTANPSLDLLFVADTLVWDDANRVPMPRRRPGGQGINATRAARELGADSSAIALLGGRTGDELERDLLAEGTSVMPIRIGGETRIFVGAHEAATHRSLLLNPRGPTIAPNEVDRAFTEVCRLIDELRPHWFAACGSLPPGLPASFYRDLGEHARARGARFVADCDGEALRLAAPVCDLLVPNQHEAQRLCEARIDTPEAAIKTARQLAREYDALVTIKLGAQGAVLTDGTNAFSASAHARSTDGSAVGAGDAFLAALLHALERALPLEAALTDAVAAGTAVLSGRGSALFCYADFEQVRTTVRARLHP